MEQLSMHQVEHLAGATNLRQFVETARHEIRKNARIGDILVAARFVAREDVEKAAATQGTGRAVKIGELLIERGLISEEQLLTALSIKFRMSFVNLDKVKPNPEAIKALSKDLATQLNVFPLDFAGRKLVVATSQPTDSSILDRLCFGTNRSIELVAARGQQITAAIKRYYSATEDVVDNLISELRDEQLTVVEEPAEPKFVEPDSKVIRLVNRILIDAQELGASDIHFEPGSGNNPLILRYRVDGECFVAHEIPHRYNNAIISRLKIVANLDISERRKPQSGKIFLKSGDTAFEYRLEVTPTVGGHEDAVLRVLTSSNALPLEKLGFTPENRARFLEMLKKPHGIVLCVGPTGAGKTTTLHSALAHINAPERKIWTAEDPVEIVQQGLRQVQVNPRIGFTFQDALRSFLRADPDVIMIGEIRDVETAKIAVAASLSGHLVFSTLHTNSSVETVSRLVEMGMEPYYFGDALIGILAQRLARRLCDSCKVGYHPDRQEYDELIELYGADLAEEHGVPRYSSELSLMRRKGCDRCYGTGYKGRVAVHELLSGVPAVKEAVKEKASVEKLRRLALQAGTRTLKMDGIVKVFGGMTDVTQVLKVCME